MTDRAAFLAGMVAGGVAAAAAVARLSRRFTP